VLCSARARVCVSCAHCVDVRCKYNIRKRKTRKKYSLTKFTAQHRTTRQVSSGMDNTMKIWSLDAADVQLAAQRSYFCEQSCGKCAQQEDTFKTCFVQFPVYSTSCVHPDYVDCVRWMGNLILSKSTDNKIILWHPDPSRHKNAIVIVKEFLFADANIWFLRFCVDIPSQTVAVGSKSGNVYVWNVGDPVNESGSVPLACKLSSMSTSTIRQTAFSPDGRFLLCCSDDGTIWRWDRRNRSGYA